MSTPMCTSRLFKTVQPYPPKAVLSRQIPYSRDPDVEDDHRLPLLFVINKAYINIIWTRYNPSTYTQNILFYSESCCIRNTELVVMIAIMITQGLSSPCITQWD